MRIIICLSICLLAVCQGTPNLKQFKKITAYQRPGQTCSTIKHFYYSPVFKVTINYSYGLYIDDVTVTKYEAFPLLYV